MREAVIVSSVRTPVGKAFKGTLRATRPDDLAAIAMQEAIRRVPGLDPKEIEDVILGCAMPEGEAGNERRAHRVASARACRSKFRRSPSTGFALRACSRLPWRPSASWSATPK